VLLLVCGSAIAQAAPIKGPRGTSRDKVLVIGTDGTRWDLVESAMEAGRAPNLARLAQRGFGMPALLKYQPPEALTISEVGWCSIATGVWPAKHGVFGYYINEDPGQATKNGYPDFLSRLEQERPKLSTFVASDWPNISLHEHGGPIFGDQIDAKHAVFAPGTIPGYDGGDQEVTDAAARYLRKGDPDAGFVYLGVVDEAAHLSGSATPAYSDEIAATDRRIGKLMRAVRSRPRRESWTVIVTTDHGEQNLDYPSAFSHGFGSTLERTSFIVAAGAGISRKQPADSVHVVDIAPTVATRLGIGVDPGWKLDGASFARR
jgi:predicted AlkP superfamily pyrophosphatase or phosphodiesterase